jgi:zinc protease
MQAVDASTALLETGYRPDRTTLVVVGNVISYSVLEQVQRTFGGYAAPAAGAVQAPPAPAPPPGASAPPGYATSRGGAGAAVVSVEYPAPGLAAADAAAVDLLATALAGGRASRLARALRLPALAAEVSGTYEGRAGEGRIGFELVVDPKRLDAAEAAFFREVERFRRERVSAAELQRARNVYERRFHAARETVEGEARVLAGFEAAHGDVRAAARHLERVRAVTAAELQSAAARVLVASRAGVREVLPPEAPERTFTAKTYAETIAAWAPNAGRDVAPNEVRDAEPAAAVPEGRERRRAGETDDVVVLPVPVPIRDFSTLNGPKAIVREDQSRPLLSIGLFYPAGRVAEPAAERGITELMLRSMLRGSRKYPGDRLAFALEQIGAEARVVNEADFFGIVLEVLSRNADQAMEIAIDLVEQPVFDKEDVARERELLLVDQRRSSGVARAVELFWQSRYPAHAYGVPAVGLPETVGRLTDEQVKAWSTRAARSQLPLVAIVGDTDGSSLVSRHVAEGFDRRDGEPPASPGLPAPAPAGEAADSRGTATAQAIGYPTPGGAWAGFDALEVAAAGAAARAQGDLDDAGARVEAVVERRRLGGAALVTAVSAPGDETRVRARVEARLAEAGAGGSDFAAAGARAAVSRLRREQPFTVLLVEYVRAAAFGAPLDTVETAGERLRGVSADAARKAAAAVFNPGLGGRGVVRGRG